MLKSLLLAWLMLLPLSAVAAPDQAGDRYDNRALGLRLSKPSEWRFLTPPEDYSGQRLAFGSPDYQQYLLARTVQALLELARHPDPYDGPGLNSRLRLRLIPAAGAPATSGKAILESLIPGQLAMAEGAEPSVPVREVVVAGRRAGHAVYHHRLRDSQGNAFPATSEIWMVFDQGYVLVLDALYSQGDRAAQEQIEQVLKTVEWTTTPIVKE